jgi:hypothetical protein
MIGKLIDLIFENPNDIHIQYSNINGEEKLLINGQEVKEESLEFDDTEIKNSIAQFKENLKKVDDNLFITFCESLGQIMDVNEFNKLLDLESFNKEEAEHVGCLMRQSKNVLIELINSRIEYLNDLKEMF